MRNFVVTNGVDRLNVVECGIPCCVVWSLGTNSFEDALATVFGVENVGRVEKMTGCGQEGLGPGL